VGEEVAVDMLHESQLRVSSLSWAGGFTQCGEFHKLPDVLAEAHRIIRFGARVGADCVLVHPGGRGGHTHNHALRISRERFNELARFAKDLAVTLVIEPMHPASAAEWTIFSSCRAAVSFLKSLDADLDNVKLVLDTYHILDDETLWPALPTYLPYTQLVQISDRKYHAEPDQQRAVLDTGRLPLRRFLLALKEHGYHGRLELEVFGDEIEDLGYEQALNQSKAFLDEFVEE
jgi:sugar phosphate isomerase/epimerase